jgi:hypothetical protein
VREGEAQAALGRLQVGHGDRGKFGASQRAGTADFIVRLGWNALQLTNPAGRAFDLIGYLPCLPSGSSPHEVNLHASVGRDEPALAALLIVQRKTPEAAEATRSALRRAAARKGKALDPRSLSAAGFMILATSLPKSGYSAKAVLVADRLGWQIELAFKRLKSLLHLDLTPDLLPDDYVLMTIDLDDLAVEVVGTIPAAFATFGDTWLREQRTAVQRRAAPAPPVG